MSPIKKFFIGYVVFYLLVSTALNVMLGPPGMSKDFLAENKVEYDRYVDVTKQDAYKLWLERPELNAPDAQLTDDIAFVEAFVEQPAFISDTKRRNTYGLIFDFFNTGMVIVLVGRFARQPLGNALDGMIEAVRKAIDDAATAHREAKARKKKAEHKIKGLAEEQSGLEEKTIERIEDMRRESALFTGESLSALNRETADRKTHEEVLMRSKLKEELVESALESLVSKLKEEKTEEHDMDYIRQFVDGLEKSS